MRRIAIGLLGLVLLGCGDRPVVELSSPTHLYFDEGLFRSRAELDPDSRILRGEDPRLGRADMLGWRSRVRVLEWVPGGAKIVVIEGRHGHRPDPSMDGKVGWIVGDELR